MIPILSQFIILDLHGEKQPAYMIHGWLRSEAGRGPRSKKEVVFDQVLAERHGLNLGDQVDVMDKISPLSFCRVAPHPG